MASKLIPQDAQNLSATEFSLPQVGQNIRDPLSSEGLLDITNFRQFSSCAQGEAIGRIFISSLCRYPDTPFFSQHDCGQHATNHE